MSAKSHEIVLRRSGEGRMAIVRCDCRVETSNEVMTLLIRGLSKWAQETELGRAEWHRSNGDFNVGDLSMFSIDENDSLYPYLFDVGIFNLDVEIYGEEGENYYHYDSVLMYEPDEEE